MPAPGLVELFLMLVIVLEVLAGIALPILALILVVRFIRQRDNRLDLIERRLEDLNGHDAPPEV